MIETEKIKKLFNRFKPADIRAMLSAPKNWLHIIGVFLFLISIYTLTFNNLPQADNNIELKLDENNGISSIKLENRDFTVEFKDIYSNPDPEVFKDQKQANDYIPGLKYEPKRKNIKTINNAKASPGNINTKIVYIDDKNIEYGQAEVKLNKLDKDKDINVLLYCNDNDFNKKTGECSNWQILKHMDMENTEDYISFKTSHFSAYAGAWLEIINTQSNLTKGDIWEVRFQTQGRSDLEIEAVQGTLFDVDIEFIGLYCGEKQILSNDIIWQSQKLTVKNYACDNEISRVRNRTITGGRHWLSFSFGYTEGALAHNFACDSGDLDTDCYVTSQQYLGDGDEISGIGNLIVQSGGDLTASSSDTSGKTYGNSFGIEMSGDITIQSGGMITGNVTVTANDIDVQSGGSINVNYKGYQQTSGPCAGLNTDAAGGGGHGGEGGDGSGSAGGCVCGSTTEPSDLGSGGGHSTRGGDGGGAVKLAITGTTTVNGTISANGQNGTNNYGGGGAGGSILINTGILNGSGTTTANGGNGCGTNDGAGGGGRIAVYYTTDNSTITYDAHGGIGGGTTQRMGGAGTIYKKSASQDHGDLIIDNNDQDYENDDYIGKTYINETITFNTLTIQNDGHLKTGASTSIAYSVFNWDEEANITDNGGILSPFSDSGSLTIATTSRLHEKVIRAFTDLTVNGTMVLHNYSTSSAGKLNVSEDVIIGSSGKLTHHYNTIAQTHVINLEAVNLIIESGGTINVDSKGYARSQGLGQPPIDNTRNGGAGYGGEGGDAIYGSIIQGGPTYGSTTVPTDLGSGGGEITYGGNGGGAVKLTIISTTTVNGTISANGGNGGSDKGGGGSGGSVLINTDAYVGTGIVTTNGGIGSASGVNGGGGGGRIAVYYTIDNSTITYDAHGGIGYTAGYMGGAGTIYIKSASQDHGDLIIDNNDQDYEDGIYIGKTVITDNLPLDTLTVQNYGHLYASSSASITYNTINWDTEAIIEDYGSTFTLFSNSPDITIATTSRLYVNTPRSFNSLTVNGKLSHWYNTTAEANKLDLNVTNNITINSGATVSVSGKGYSGGYGPGAGTDEGTYGSGAGHGGVGGATADASSAGGSTYDSTTTPVNIGSGGGDDGGVTGGPAGGGAIKLTAGATMTINANISANGDNAANTNGGGASGGSIYLICDTLAGAATLSAGGGNPQAANAGGGGGGRIALDYNTNNAVLLFNVDGGGTTYPGADGTIYPDAEPAISTQAATSITVDSATGNGSVDSLGINSITEHGHDWATSTMASSTPVSHWKMNDNAADTTVVDSVGGNNGTAQQNTSVLASTSAKLNGALEFNGSSDHIETNKKASDFGINGYNPRSVSAWAYTRSFNNGGIFECGQESTLQDFSLRTLTSDNQWRTQLWGSDIDFSYTSKNKWVHFVVNYDGSQIEIYADNSIIAQGSKALNTADTKTFKIGRWQNSYFNGYIDDIRVYDYALTEDEIAQLYNSGIGTEHSDAFASYSQLGAKDSTGSFISSITGLTYSTTYYYRSYTELTNGSVIYGDIMEFNTPDPPKYIFNPGGTFKLEGTFKFE